VVACVLFTHGLWADPAIIEGPIPGPVVGYESMQPPQAGAVILPSVPADYDWWNGCSPTAAGMLFGWWDEQGYGVFPGDHRNLPATYPGTSSVEGNYMDARGTVAGWAHKQEGQAQSLTYGSWQNHVPDSIADFILTSDGGTSRSNMEHGFEMFAAWDDPDTPECESSLFDATTAYTPAYGGAFDYATYCAAIDAGIPVHLGLTGPTGGHSVLGVGYNNSGGAEDVVLLTTWHSGLQQWEWANETQSGHGFSVYGGTLMTPVSTPTPELSAYVAIEHTYIGDLSVTVGLGDPGNPLWTTTAWSNGGGGSNNLILTDIDLTGIPDYAPGDGSDWFVEVADNAGGDQGSVFDFQIRYQGNTIYDYDGPPVAILDNQGTTVSLQTAPEPSSLALLLLGTVVAMVRRRRC